MTRLDFISEILSNATEDELREEWNDYAYSENHIYENDEDSICDALSGLNPWEAIASAEDGVYSICDGFFIYKNGALFSFDSVVDSFHSPYDADELAEHIAENGVYAVYIDTAELFDAIVEYATEEYEDCNVDAFREYLRNYELMNITDDWDDMYTTWRDDYYADREAIQQLYKAIDECLFACRDINSERYEKQLKECETALSIALAELRSTNCIETEETDEPTAEPTEAEPTTCEPIEPTAEPTHTRITISTATESVTIQPKE